MEFCDFDEGPLTTLRQRLTESGALPLYDLNLLIERLADINVVFESTDHLDDATLLTFIVQELDEPRQVPDDPLTVTHFDLCNGNEDAYLRYYASDEDRVYWLENFPDDPMPPKESPPYDRDRFMKKPRRDRELECSANRN